MALARRNPPEDCVHHSDHGSQYVSLILSKTMRENGIRPSMGSILPPWDNAAMESLMGIVKSEYVHAQTYAIREEAALDLFEYIEVVYNGARTHSALGYLSPAELKRPTGPRKTAARRRRKGCQRNRGRFTFAELRDLAVLVGLGASVAGEGVVAHLFVLAGPPPER